MPVPLDWVLDALVGVVLAAVAAVRRQALTAAALLALLTIRPEALR